MSQVAEHTRMEELESTAPVPSLSGHFAILRIDHWVKNVFVLPGIIVAIAWGLSDFSPSELIFRVLIGLVAIGLVASSNYTINEVLDAPFDGQHAIKKHRPVPSGKVSVPIAYFQWVAVGASGLALSTLINWEFFWTMLALWLMGCVYNIRPIRSKDVPYLDVITESVNNPLRMLAGWYIVTSVTTPPVSLLLSYWFVGCYFMAIKRFSEHRQLGSDEARRSYRLSLSHFSETRLLVSVVFYGSAAMLFFGAFLMRYRIEMVLSFPFVALVMAMYLLLGFRADGAAQNPEKLYKEHRLMFSVVLCAVVMAVLLVVDMPWLSDIFSPTIARR